MHRRNQCSNRVAWGVLLSLWLAGPAPGQTTVPGQVNFQGLLLDSGGTPVNGLVELVVTLYDSESGGTALWTEAHPDVDVLDGVYTVALGSVSPLTPAVLASGSVHLEIEVDGETMTPRQRLLAVPYALHAAVADSAATADAATTAQSADTVVVGSLETSLVIDSDNTGTGPADGAGVVIEGGSGPDARITWDAASGAWNVSDPIRMPLVPPSEMGRAIYWPVSVGPSEGPFEESLFGMNIGSTTASGDWNEVDNVFRLCYNQRDCNAATILLPGEHAFAWTWEASYDSDAGTAGHTWVENNLGVRQPDGGSDWRPYTWRWDVDDDVAWWGFQSRPDRWALRIATNGLGPPGVVIGPSPRMMGAAADIYWAASDLVGPHALRAYADIDGAPNNPASFAGLLEIEYTGPSGVQVGDMDGLYLTVARPTDADNVVTGGMIGISTNVGFSGSPPTAASILKMIPLDVGLDFSGENGAINQVRAVRIRSPRAPGAGTTISNFRGLDIEDLGGYGGTRSHAVVIHTQTAPSQPERRGNFAFQGGNWNNGHFQLGSDNPAVADHFWRDQASEVFRVATDHPPANASDGDAIVTGTGSDAFGPASWAATGTNGDDACANMGLRCVAAYDIGGDGTELGCAASAAPRVVCCK